MYFKLKMKSLIVVLFFCGIYIGFSTCAPKKAKECNSVNKADTCMQKLLLLGDPKFKFPLDKNEMNSHCKTITETEKCIKDYSSKCLDTFPRQVTSVLAFGVAKTNKGYCSSQKRKDKFIGIGSCGNNIKDGGRQCMQNYIDTLLGVENLQDTKLKVPMICCHYFKLKQCIVGLSQKSCTQEQTFEVEKIVDGYATEVLNLLCGDYTEESDKCDSIYGKEPKKLASQKRPASILPPFITILSDV